MAFFREFLSKDHCPDTTYNNNRHFGAKIKAVKK